MGKEPQTFQGYWSAPPNTKELPGTLTIESGVITLKLIGAFAETVYQAEPVPKLLVGLTNKGKQITLFQLVGYVVSWGHGIPTSTYTFKFALVGVAARGLHDLKAREVHCTSAKIDEWLTELDGVEADYAEQSWRIQVNDVPDRVLVDTPELQVLHTYALSSSEHELHRNPSIKRNGWFFLNTKKRVPLLRLLEHKEHLRHLMSFLLNEDVDFDRIEFVLRMKPLTTVECYEARQPRRSSTTEESVVPLLEYDRLRANWVGLVSSWFANQEPLNHFIRFYVDGTQADADPVQKFLALVKSLEAVHREWIAKSNREWVNFRPAMKSCIAFSRPVWSRHFRITNMEGYTKQLKELRDAFSHGRNPYYRDKIDFKQLQWRSRELHEILAASLLLKLGIPDALLKRSLRRDALIRHWPRRNFRFVRYRR